MNFDSSHAVRLRASGLTAQRAGEPVFEPVDLALAAGNCLVVTGANGAGKTTLLRTLAGIMEAATGTVTRSACQYAGHQPAVKADLTCRENLDFHRAFGGAVYGQRTDTALMAVGLAGLGLRPARSLSAGQKKRLALARLLVSPRPLWLLDEPYASLDDAGGQMLDNLLSGHLETGGAVVVATHQRLPVLPRGHASLEVHPTGVPE